MHVEEGCGGLLALAPSHASAVESLGCCRVDSCWSVYLTLPFSFLLLLPTVKTVLDSGVTSEARVLSGSCRGVKRIRPQLRFRSRAVRVRTGRGFDGDGCEVAAASSLSSASKGPRVNDGGN